MRFLAGIGGAILYIVGMLFLSAALYVTGMIYCGFADSLESGYNLLLRIAVAKAFGLGIAFVFCGVVCLRKSSNSALRS